MDQYKEMQERLDKVGKAQPMMPVKEKVDRSEMEARLNNAPTPIKTSSGLPERIVTVPVAKSAPAVAVETVKPIPAPKLVQSPPVEFLTPTKAPIAPVVPPVRERAPDPVPSVAPSIEQQKDHEIPSPAPRAEHFPPSAPSSKAGLSLLAWIGIALFVAIVIAQLWYVMS